MAHSERAEPARELSDLPAGSWWAALRRTIREFRRDNLTDWAAALTYYSVLSIFPALLVLVSLIGLAGQDANETLTENVEKFAPGEVRDILTSALSTLRDSQGTAGLLAIVGLAAALWSASGYVAAFMRASNVIYDVPEGRPVWKTVPIRVAITLAMMIMLAASVVIVAVTGGVADRVGDFVGVGDTAVTVWNIAKWPVLVLLVSIMFALLFWASPNARQPFRWVTPGGLIAVLVWLVASAAFAFYVANFGSYNATYGALAGVVIFLIWLWITNIAILLGAELNAEVARGRAVSGGQPVEEEPYVEPRDTRKFDDPGAAP